MVRREILRRAKSFQQPVKHFSSGECGLGGELPGPASSPLTRSWVAIERHSVTLAGTWPYVRTVMVEFPSMEKARQWYDSGEYAEIIPLRERAIDANIRDGSEPSRERLPPPKR